MNKEDFNAWLEKQFITGNPSKGKLLLLRPDQIEWLQNHGAVVTPEGHYTFPEGISDAEIWLWLRILAT